jgi:RNA polymerase sigma-70 factor (family 1)
MAEAQEKQWLAQAALGDEQAFTRLFHSYHQRLGAYVLGWTKSPSMAEEIVQDVFMKVWINRENLAAVERFENYIYILSRNYTFNALRQASRERVRQKEWLRYFDRENDQPHDRPPEEYLKLIEQAVGKLPPQQQKVYRLKQEQSLKYEEIAALLHISPETARKHLQTAMGHIRTYVQAHVNVTFLILSTPLLLSERFF